MGGKFADVEVFQPEAMQEFLGGKRQPTLMDYPCAAQDATVERLGGWHLAILCLGFLCGPNMKLKQMKGTSW